MFHVFKDPDFDKKVKKLLSEDEQEELNKFINRLKSGNINEKSLTFDFLKEYKIKGKRIYFLVYTEIKLILLVSASNKKAQKGTINYIKMMLPEFRMYSYKLYNEIEE